jgi:hypothetical protein
MTQATARAALCTLAGVPGNTGMCATWQIWQVASDPGASVCMNEMPEATSTIAANAAASSVARNQREDL